MFRCEKDRLQQPLKKNQRTLEGVPIYDLVVARKIAKIVYLLHTALLSSAELSWCTRRVQA